jgi:hypothetical protein
MTCPSEFTISQYVDRELPEAESAEVIAHLEICGTCRRVAAALESENLLIARSLQNVNLWETERELAAHRLPKTLKTGLLAAALVGTAFLLRMGLGVLENLAAPAGFHWLSPFDLSGQMNWIVSAFFYIWSEGSFFMASFADKAGFIILAFCILGTLIALARRARGITTIVGLAAVVCAFVIPGYSVEIRRPEKGEGIVSIGPGETLNDTLVAFADSITIQGTVTGDLIAFGRQINVPGTVRGNIVVFAQNLELPGNVGSDIFAFAQSVQINGAVGQNAICFAQSVGIGSAARLQNAILGGANMNLSGEIARDLTAFGAFLDVRSQIGRDLRFWGQRIQLLSPAKIGRDVYAHVKAYSDAKIDPGVAIAGNREIELQKPKPSRYLTATFYISQLLQIGAAFLTGLLLIWLFPRTGGISFSSGRTLLRSGGIGFLALVAAPVAAILLAITLIGLPIGLVTLLLWLLGLYLAKIVIARYVGGTILGLSDAKMSSAALALLVGLLIVRIAVNLPLVGGVLNFLLILIGLGALIIVAYRSWELRRSPGEAIE